MNKINPIFSVIVPCYNYAKYLPECLDSVLAQTYSNWECIVVDNNSNDNTAEVAKAYGQKDERIKYILHSVKGVAGARNKAIEHAIGDYILPLDADDKIGENYLKKALKTFNQNPDCKLVYCKANLFDAYNQPWKLPNYNYKNLLQENALFCSSIFKKSDFDCSLKFNENMVQGFEDWDFWIGFLNEKDVVIQIDEVLFYYRIRPESRNNSLSEEKQRTLRLQIFENHKEKYLQHFNLSDVLFDNYLLKNQLNAIKKSNSFKLGKEIVKPFQFVQSILKK